MSSSIDHPHVSVTAPEDWKYIAEGGSTLVLSYVGPQHETFSGTVLRLRKSDLTHSFEETPEFWSEPDDPILEFQAEVIEKLIPPSCLPRFQSAAVDRVWLQRLADRVQELRPDGRKKKDRIDITRRKAVLATDLIGGKGWAVEIKPKWGFLPSSKFFLPETRPIKTQTCRFCMHSHYRSVTKGETPPTAYCPLDLYSGNEARVTKAVHGLWEGWRSSKGSANNLRIFVDGHLINPTDPSSLSTLSGEIMHQGSPTDLKGAFTSALIPLLMTSPVLPTLSHLQRSLDAIDIEGLHAVLDGSGVPFNKEALERDGSDVDPLYREPDVRDWETFVDAYMAHQQKHQSFPTIPASNAELRYRILSYLFSMSFKDCSVILNLPSQASAGLAGPGRITVIDLDVKTVRKLEQWETLDAEIVQAYARVPEPQRKHCFDARVGETAPEPLTVTATQQEQTGGSVQFLVLITVLVTFCSFVLIPLK